MRRFAASAGFILATLILAALSWALWQSSFVAAKGVPAMDLRYTPPEVRRTAAGVIGKEGDSAVLRAAGEVPRMELRWVQPPPARYAHVSLEVSVKGVVVGRYPWEDARIFLMWFDAHGKRADGHLPLWSGFGDQERQTKDVMVPLARDGTLPCVVLENRGTAGTFTIHAFSIQPAELRPGFAWMLGLLLLSWLGLTGCAVRRWVAKEGAGLPRIAIAAALWVGFAWVSSFPGPWIPWHPLGKPFPVKHLPGAEILKPRPQPVPAAPPPASSPAPPPTADKAPPPVVPAEPPAAAPAPAVEASGSAEQGPPERLGGGPVRWFLNHLPGLKRPIHLLAFAGLTTLIALLTGSVRAGWPAFALGILSEFSQWAFGFGFDGGDVLDLLFDAAAVLAGLAMWQWARRSFLERREAETVAIQSPASNP